MKATLPQDGIAFQHLDLNLTKYLECGRGAKRVQTSCTLTQETENNCTLVVPGFHKVIKDWWNDVIDRGSNVRSIEGHSSNCLKTNDIFNAEDKKKYGDFVPVICGPGDIRISRSEILHGSASDKNGKASTTRRWVVNPWFVAIQQDHETLDIPEVGTWSTIAAAHRDLIAPTSTPSGQVNTHGRPIGRFAPDIPLHHISSLSDALIGQRRWDDSLVRLEAEIVLGSDDVAAWSFVNNCRLKVSDDLAAYSFVNNSQLKVLSQYKVNMRVIRDLEKTHYGKRSYYYLCEHGLFQEPRWEGDYVNEDCDGSEVSEENEENEVNTTEGEEDEEDEGNEDKSNEDEGDEDEGNEDEGNEESEENKKHEDDSNDALSDDVLSVLSVLSDDGLFDDVLS